nr:MOSC domain-containing protein [Halorhodospira halophila]
MVGGPGELPPDRHPTGFYKQEVQAPCWLGPEGLDGDHHADRRVHGGPERAVNHYPAEHLPGWAHQFPVAAGRFVPGAFGENLSTEGWLETGVAVGDRFRLGAALIEVAQPRLPCWKVDRRFDVEGMARAMVETGRTGWLYRVIEPGTVEPGATLERCSVHPQRLTIDELWGLHREPRADRQRMALAAEMPELAAAWRERFRQRVAWLERQGRG